MIEIDHTRTVLSFTGTDKEPFLQSLLTNSVCKLSTKTCVYAAFLTPQGKYVFDIFLYYTDDIIYAEIPKNRADFITARLSLYILRRDVQIQTRKDLYVYHATKEYKENFICCPDPRSLELGYRGLVVITIQGNRYNNINNTYYTKCIDQGIPLDTTDLRPDTSYVLEMGFARLNGVDFKKGCYIGQEITARMHHKTTLKKGLVKLVAETAFGPNDNSIVTDTGKEVGLVGLRIDNQALALIKLDAVSLSLNINNIPVNVSKVFSYE